MAKTTKGTPKADPLDEVEGEQRLVALRMRELVTALFRTQEEFADATGILQRSEVSMACNGGTLARTNKWLGGISQAAKVDLESADAYMRGKIDLDELLRRRAARGGELREGAEELSPNLARAVKTFAWRPETTPALRALVREQARQHWRFGGTDFPIEDWERVLYGLERDALGLHARRVGARPSADIVDGDAPDPSVEAEKAARKAKRLAGVPKRR